VATSVCFPGKFFSRISKVVEISFTRGEISYLRVFTCSATVKVAVKALVLTPGDVASSKLLKMLFNTEDKNEAEENSSVLEALSFSWAKILFKTEFSEFNIAVLIAELLAKFDADFTSKEVTKVPYF